MTTPTKPVAGDDHYSFFEDQAIGGNVLANDTPGSNGALYLRSFENSDVLAKIANQVTDIVGTYGTFHLKANGDWTYTLSDAAKVNFFAGMTYHESVQYKISDGAGHTDAGIFTLDIQGVTTKPVAVDDNYTFGENDAIHGNVLDNDIPGETGQLFLRSVTGTDIAAKQGPGQTTDVSGTYGTFHFHADGSFTYDLDATVKANLNDGQHVTETLQYYKISDGKGHTDVGTITLTVDGHTDAVAPNLTMNFEDVDTSALGYAVLPADYHGFAFSTPNHPGYATIANAQEGSGGTGYEAVSQENGNTGNVSLIPFGDAPLSIAKTDHSTFDFEGGFFASAFNASESVTITGWHNGSQVYTDTVVLNATTATHITLDWHDIDQIQMSSDSGLGNQITFDDLQFHV